MSFIDPKGVDALVELSRAAGQQRLHFMIHHQSPAIEWLDRLLDGRETALLGEAH